MGSFYAPTCKTDCVLLLCKFCKNWISVPNIVHQLTLSLRCKYCKIHNCSIFPDAINSIRRLAASDCKPMTSVFYDVIRLESVRGRSNVLIKGHFWRFWGIWTPKCCRPSYPLHKGTSLRHNACFETSRVKFHARVASLGKSGEKLKREALYFMYFARSSFTADWHKFWVTCSSRGHNQLCKVLS